jgi:sodium-dependent dicarboxylate transporter 2/3/5
LFICFVSKPAEARGYDPAVFLLAVTFASSFAFMLPMAGGPNLLVYSTKRVSVQFMAKNGFFLKPPAILIGVAYIATLLPILLGHTHELLHDDDDSE